MGSSNVTVPRWIQSRLGGPRRVSVGLCCWCCADGTGRSRPLRCGVWAPRPGACRVRSLALCGSARSTEVWSVGAGRWHWQAMARHSRGRTTDVVHLVVRFSTSRESCVGNITISKSNGVVCSHVQLQATVYSGKAVFTHLSPRVYTRGAQRLLSSLRCTWLCAVCSKRDE